jgi:hypothetical protein
MAWAKHIALRQAYDMSNDDRVRREQLGWPARPVADELGVVRQHFPRPRQVDDELSVVGKWFRCREARRAPSLIGYE